MFDIKGNLKAFHSVDYCNEVFWMPVLIILSPYSAFRKLANENIIEFVLFCVGYSGMVSNFGNIKHLFLSDLRQNIFSLLKCVLPFVRFSQHWLWTSVFYHQMIEVVSDTSRIHTLYVCPLNATKMIEIRSPYFCTVDCRLKCHLSLH